MSYKPSAIEANNVALHIQLGIRFCLWAGNSTPPIADIRTRWGVSRATAYRWLRALKDARGSV